MSHAHRQTPPKSEALEGQFLSGMSEYSSGRVMGHNADRVQVRLKRTLRHFSEKWGYLETCTLTASGTCLGSRCSSTYILRGPQGHCAAKLWNADTCEHSSQELASDTAREKPEARFPSGAVVAKHQSRKPSELEAFRVEDELGAARTGLAGPFVGL